MLAAEKVRENEEARPVFEPPSPGVWQHDAAHWPRPVTPWSLASWGTGYVRGFKEGMSRYGILLSHLQPAAIHGHFFVRHVPAADPADGEGAARELERRFAAARDAFEGRIWRDDLELWDREIKPDSIARNSRLQAVPVEELDDATLADHVVEVFANHEEMVYRHHKFTIGAVFATGHFVARTAAWTGLPTAQILGLLAGSTPISNGIAADELREVGLALAEAELGPQSFGGMSAAQVVERLRDMPGRVGLAVRAYLDRCGTHSASGYDVTDRMTIEMPDVILGAFWHVADSEDDERPEDLLAARTRAIRSAVPPEHRAEFDALLAEARHVNRLRDERGVYNDNWSAGISRRALLEAGRRLALRGRLDDADLLFEATPDEIVALLRGEPGPTSAELSRRHAQRHLVPLADVPAFVGDPPQPPPLDTLPPHARAAAEAIGVAITEVLGQATDEHEPSVVVGKGVSPGVYEGTARLVTGPADFRKLRRGDVLVTVCTSASFNVVLPLLGALVTDRGALLSHAAIVAREHGIPGVVGTREGTRRIPDGARVRVDGARGRVEVLR